MKKITLCIILVLTILTPIAAFAETTSLKDVKSANCPDANAQSTIQGIVTVSEERFGNVPKDGILANDSNGISKILNCVRINGCIYDTEKKKWSCESQYKNTCSDGIKVKYPAGTQTSISTTSQTAESKKNLTPYATCTPVQITFSSTGTSLLFGYLKQIYQYAITLGSTLAVLFLIAGGIMKASSGDSSENETKGKDLIKRSITGLIVLLLSALILYTINPNFFTFG